MTPGCDDSTDFCFASTGPSSKTYPAQHYRRAPLLPSGAMAFTSALKKPNPGDARLPSKPSKDLPSCSPSASKLLFELTPAELIEITADVLQRTIDANNALLGGRKQARSEITRFHTRDPPPISVKAYLAR